jgi:cell division protein FtsI/penicillin-binding protein 2
MPSKTIQTWLYNFGFGRKTLMPAHYPGLLKELKRTESKAADRQLPESGGIIYTDNHEHDINCIEDLPPMKSIEKRRFGIGQASMRVTVLQVANSMATLARKGVFQNPRLFIGDTENKKYRPVPLGISSSTLRVIRDGMHAVVYESGGTARSAYTNKKFKYNEKFPKRNITVFGKTGSTQQPYNAWFACFAEDKSGRSLAFAIVVKRGASGSKDAAPKGMRIIEICNEMGYIGDKPEKPSTP